MRLIFHLLVIFQVRYVLKMSQPVGLDYFSATVHYSTSLRIWAVSGYRPHAVSSLWGCSHQDGTTSGGRSQSGPSQTMAVTGKASSRLIFCHFSWCWCLNYGCVLCFIILYYILEWKVRKKEAWLALLCFTQSKYEFTSVSLFNWFKRGPIMAISRLNQLILMVLLTTGCHFATPRPH